MYTDIRTEPCVAYHRDLALNASYNQLPFYFNAHKKEPSDLSSRRKVERHPDYNHLEHQQRTENDIELTSRVGEVEQSDVSSKRTAVRHFKVIPWKGCTNSSTKCLGALLTTALVVGCLALLLATIALSITGRPSSSSGFNELQLMEEIKQLKSQVGTLQENQMNNSTNEQKLTKEIWQLQSQVGTLQESQTTLQLLVDTLKKQVNSPVNLYQNCIEETRSCRMGQNQPNVYRRECVTGQVPIEEPGFYTINMRCDYDSNRFFLETAYLRRSGDQVRCVCEVTYPLPDTAGHAVLSIDLQFTCNLVVTRCPQSQQIINQT